MSRLLQIYEDDLAELERAVPALTAALGAPPPALRMKIRRVKEILSDVRWDYQPHIGAGTIPAHGGEGCP